MAHIDNLIASIKDPQLRAALQTEYRKISKTRRFGLVFDRHLPESVVLPGFKVKSGDKVQVGADAIDDPTIVDGSGIWTAVTENRYDGTWFLRDAEGNTRTVPRDRVIATHQFGDTIYPGLKSTGRILRGGGVEGDTGDKPFHAVINAENYHALETLLYPYEGRVDVIYIDPPYNTGARDWKYNNDYIDDNDPYRHSKWLSFMEKRLKLAQRLLNPSNSVMVVTIDEKEYLRVGLLLEQTFPEARITMVSSSINSAGATRKGTFARAAEYLYFVQLGSSRPASLVLDAEWNAVKTDNKKDIYWSRLIRSGADSARSDSANQFYPVFIREIPDGPVFLEVGEPYFGQDLAEITGPVGATAVWPIRKDGSEGRWRVSAAVLKDLIAKGHARLGQWRDGETTIYYLKQGESAKVLHGEFQVVGRRADGSVIADGSDYESRFVPTDIWRITSHDAGNSGSRLISKLIPGRRFPFPKSLYAVEDCLRFFVADNPHALILDFFAGSGTTLHAVARLNHADSGRRRSIIVTNNEVSLDERAALLGQGLKPGDPAWEALGICHHITIPRVRAAITGQASNGQPITGDYKFVDEFPMSDGLDENVEFFDLTYEDPTIISLGRNFEAIAPLLWLKAGAIGTRIDRVDRAGWALPDDASYGILFTASEWPKFVAAATARENSPLPLTHLFIVTDSEVEFTGIASRLDRRIGVTRLYTDYLRSFQINRQRSLVESGDDMR